MRRKSSPRPFNDRSLTMSFSTALAHHFLPESILVLGVLALILIGAWRGTRAFGLVNELAVALIGLAILALFFGQTSDASLFEGPSSMTPSRAS